MEVDHGWNLLNLYRLTIDVEYFTDQLLTAFSLSAYARTPLEGFSSILILPFLLQGQ